MRSEISAKSETEEDKLLGLHTTNTIEEAHLEQSIIDNPILEEEETIGISEDTDNIFIKIKEEEDKYEHFSETSIDNEIKKDECKEEAEGGENYIKEEAQGNGINIKEEVDGDEDNMDRKDQEKRQHSLLDTICKVCLKNFKKKSDRDRHIRFVHENEKNFACETCNRRFSTTNHRNQHVRSVHEKEKKFACEVCEKRFSRKTLLTVHERIHSGEKPYQCENCDKSFGDKSHLRRHVKSHSGTKDFQCIDCGKLYSSNRTLKQHVENIHLHRD